MDYDQAQPGSFTRTLPHLTKITDRLTLIVKDIRAGKQALKLFRDAMYASLKDKLPPDVWDYPTP